MKKSILTKIIVEEVKATLQTQPETNSVENSEIAPSAEVTAKSLGIKDDVGKFYLVIKPKTSSKLEDIWFETTLFDFANRIKGGLKLEDLAGIFDNRSDAKYEATQLMKTFDGQMTELKKEMDEYRVHKAELENKKKAAADRIKKMKDNG